MEARPLVVAGWSAMIVAVVVGVLALPRPERPLPSRTAVELPSGVAVEEGLTGQEAAQALAPFDPHRLSCRPLGCERWWVGGSVEQVSPVGFDGHLVVAFSDGLAAVETATGARGWDAPLATLQPDPNTGWTLRASELELAADDDALLVWAPRGFVQLRDRDGDERWSVTLPETRRLWAAQLASDSVLVIGSQGSAGGPIEVVTAYDRRHGTVRWRQRVQWLYSADRDGVLVRTKDDRVALLEPSTGRVAFHLDVERPRWISSLGAFYVARVDGPTTVLLDRRSGEAVREVDGVADVADLQEPAGGIALLVAGSHGEQARPARVEAIGGDGSTRWVHEVGCCPRFVSSPPGAVAARLVGGGPPLLLAASDGAELRPPALHTSGEPRWLSDELLFAAGREVSLVIDGEGSRIALDGRKPRVVHLEPLIVVSRDGLLGIDPSVAAPALGPSPEPTWYHDPVRDRTPRAR